MVRYGGKSARQLLRTLDRYGQLLILTHENPDPDSIAAGAALEYIAATSLGLPTTLAYAGIIGRAENKAMVELLGFDLAEFDPGLLAPRQAIAIVDAQPEAGNLPLPPDVVPTIVIDHHPLTPALAQARFVDVRPLYGATSTILAEYLLELRLPIPSHLATALYYGIKADTQNLSRHTTDADWRAYTYLWALVDKDLLPKIEYPRLPRQYFETFRAAMERAYVYDGIVVSTLEEMDNPNAVAEVADLLLRLEGIVWSLCLGFFGDYLYVSLRTSDPDLHAGQAVRKALRGIGSSGGHGVMAGGKVLVAHATREERRKALWEVESRFLTALGARREAREKLLGVKPRRGPLTQAVGR